MKVLAIDLSYISLRNCNNKDTGLIIFVTFGGTSSVRSYDFDNVDDSIFVEPDLSQYEIK